MQFFRLKPADFQSDKIAFLQGCFPKTEVFGKSHVKPQIMRRKENLTEEELLCIFGDAYRYFCADELALYLRDDFHYASQHVFGEITSKKAYLDYLTGKLKTIKNAKPPMNKLDINMVYDKFSGRPYLFMRQNKDTALFLAKVENGQLVRIDLCMPALFRFDSKLHAG